MTVRSFELPPHKQRLHRKAVRLEWMTIAYLLSATFFLFLTIGSSQAGKAALVEDLLSLTPPLAFLIAARIRRRNPDERHPGGITAASRSPTWRPRSRCSSSEASSSSSRS